MPRCGPPGPLRRRTGWSGGVVQQLLVGVLETAVRSRVRWLVQGGQHRWRGGVVGVPGGGGEPAGVRSGWGVGGVRSGRAWWWAGRGGGGGPAGGFLGEVALLAQALAVGGAGGSAVGAAADVVGVAD